MAINDMSDIDGYTQGSVDLPTHSAPVNIFMNTRAIDVPRKLNSLATTFKEFNVAMREAWDSYITSEGESIRSYLNNSMQTITDYVNSEIVTKQNQFISDGTETIESIQDVANELVSEIEDATVIFKDEIRDEMDSYASSVSYSIAEENSLVFSGSTSSDTYDSRVRLLSVTQGAITTSNITYDNRNRIASFTETIAAGTGSFTKNYTISYEIGKIPQVTEA